MLKSTTDVLPSMTGKNWFYAEKRDRCATVDNVHYLPEKSDPLGPLMFFKYFCEVTIH